MYLIGIEGFNNQIN